MNFPIADIAKVLMKAVDEIITPPKGTPLDGWHTFNKFTGGLRPYEFSLFCGPTGAGKSLWLANMVAKLIDQNQKVFVAPVEIGEVEFTKMILSVFAQTDFISGEDLDLFQQQKLREALRGFQDKILENLVVTTYSGRVDVDEFISLMKHVNDTYGANVAIADNLNFMLKPSRGGDQTLEMDETIHKFVQFVKITPMHFFLVVHPRKTFEGKIISEFDIKGSSTAVQEATNILLMNRPTEAEIENDNLSHYDREFVFKKIRKRGKNVNIKFYMRNSNALGKYVEHFKEKEPNTTRDSAPLAKKWGGRGANRGRAVTPDL